MRKLKISPWIKFLKNVEPHAYNPEWISEYHMTKAFTRPFWCSPFFERICGNQIWRAKDNDWVTLRLVQIPASKAKTNKSAFKLSTKGPTGRPYSIVYVDKDGTMPVGRIYRIFKETWKITLPHKFIGYFIVERKKV